MRGEAVDKPRYSFNFRVGKKRKEREEGKKGKRGLIKKGKRSLVYWGVVEGSGLGGVEGNHPR